MDQRFVWVVDDDASILWVLEKALSKQAYQVRTFSGVKPMLTALKKSRPDVVISDVQMPGVDGLKLLDLMHQNFPAIPVIIMTAYSDLETTIKSYKSGAFEYLPKPFDIQAAIDLVARAMPNKASRVKSISEKLLSKPDHSVQNLATKPKSTTPSAQPFKADVALDLQMIGASKPMQEVFKRIGRLSESDINVLMVGDAGTGKKLAASALHQASQHSAKAFVEINAALIPQDSLETELFGYERGTFEGANEARLGRFEQAQGGTLFLGDMTAIIDKMSDSQQSRLFSVLTEKTFYRLGGHEPITLDARIIATTAHAIDPQIESGRALTAFVCALNAVTLVLPTLSARSKDVPKLATHFLASAATEGKLEPKKLSLEALKHLCQYPWPGNVRELENACKHLAVMAPESIIHARDLDPVFRGSGDNNDALQAWQISFKHQVDALLNTAKPDISRALQAKIDEILIYAALEYTGGHKQQAAKALGWGRNTLTRKIQELEL